MFWKMPNGMNSDIFMQNKMNVEKPGFYGVMWRFQGDSATKVVAPDVESKIEARLGQIPLDSHMVREAIEKGLPVARSDSGHTSEHARQQEIADRIMAENMAKLKGIPAPEKTESESEQPPQDLTLEQSMPVMTVEEQTAFYNSMTKDKLVEIAASLGVLNMQVTKQKLIEQIIEKNSVAKNA